MADFWIKTSGTWINIVTVLIGTILRLILRNRISKSGQEIIPQAVGLLTVFLVDRSYRSKRLRLKGLKLI